MVPKKLAFPGNIVMLEKLGEEEGRHRGPAREVLVSHEEVSVPTSSQTNLKEKLSVTGR